MWRAFFGLIRKEFIQVTRDRNMLRIIFLMPVIQLLVLGYAVNTDVTDLWTDFHDYDRSQESRELVQSFTPGGYFTLTDRVRTEEQSPLWELDDRFLRGKSQITFIIPEDFSKSLALGRSVRIAAITDGSDANSAMTGLGYSAQIINKFNSTHLGFVRPITLHHDFKYNPELESIYYMVPGIVATLLTMVTISLTAMAIVREREQGTLEQLSVTPISTWTLMLGKLTTFAILGMGELVLALTVGMLWFGVPFVGSPISLFALALLYLLTTLGLGMFFSTMSSTQQQAMFLAWFFSIFALLTSGFFTPIENMPHWMQQITYINPLRYFMVIVRGIIMKGTSFTELTDQWLPLLGYGLAIFGIAAARFSKRVA